MFRNLKIYIKTIECFKKCIYNYYTRHKFVTGNATLPMGGLKLLYENLKPIVIEYLPQLRDTKSPRLPTASTCLRMISLPYYGDKETLKEYLFKAMDCNSLDFV